MSQECRIIKGLRGCRVGLGEGEDRGDRWKIGIGMGNVRVEMRWKLSWERGNWDKNENGEKLSMEN